MHIGMGVGDSKWSWLEIWGDEKNIDLIINSYKLMRPFALTHVGLNLVGNLNYQLKFKLEFI